VKESIMSASAAHGEHMPRVTAPMLEAMKASKRPIAMVTAYDTPSARLVDGAGVDAILVGDSLGMTVLGYDSTLPVTMDEMVSATAAVSRGAMRSLVVADMPFMSYQASVEDAVRNAGRLVAEGHAQAVKLEGGAHVAQAVRRIVAAGIPVMGHLGLTPQSVNTMGGYKVQAKQTAGALRLVEDAEALQDAGVFAIVLECIPAELAAIVTAELHVPTIGIGAGAGCDGQVQVFHDLLGLGGDFVPRHAKRYADVGSVIREAVSEYADEVRDGEFPGDAQGTKMDPAALSEVRRALGNRRPKASGER
jgi:3-methyl-2-oxobutanoate hydroxymethyltransferase